MKKKKSKVASYVSRIVNVREWIDWSRIRAGGKYIANGAKQLFVPSATKPTESFKQAQVRMKLTDKELALRCRSLYRLSLLMAVLAVLLLGYGIYHLIYGTVHAAILTFALMFLSLSIAFRYHFWYFQIKSRKLGCTIHEWFRQGLMGDKT